MAILSRLNIVSGQRLDVVDFARLESAIASDFLQLTKHFFTTDQSFIGRGFTITPSIIGTNATSVIVDFNDCMVWHSKSADANSSGMYIGPASGGTKTAAISSAANVTNYIYCDFSTFTGANAPRAFWSVIANNNQGGEFIASIDTARFLDVTFNSTTSAGSVPATAFMIAIVRTNGSGTVASLEDARNLYWRQGTGGTSPNANATFSWPEGRTENSNLSTSSSVNPFYGADKGLESLRDWMQAVMESIREIKGSSYWYSNSVSTIGDLLFDATSSYISGTGRIQHDLSTAGQIAWTSDMYIKSIHGRLRMLIPQSESPEVLADDEVLYLDVARNYLLNGGLLEYNFNSSSSTITATTVGAFQTALNPIDNSTKQVFIGDWIKITTDNFSYWSQITDYSLDGGTTFAIAAIGIPIPSTANAVQIFNGLNNYPGITASGVQAHYHQGYFTQGTATSVNPGNLKTANKTAILQAGNHYWLAVRDDNGSSPARVYLRQFGELIQGEEREINDETPQSVLDFMGAPDEATATPDYEDHTGNSLRAGLANALENQMLWFTSGDITWAAGAGTITFTSDIQIRPANETFIYTIPSSESPLVVSSDGQVAYATLDRTGAVLSLEVANSNLFDDAPFIPLSSSALNNVKLFFRKADSLYGPDNTLWLDGNTFAIGSAGSSVAPVNSNLDFVQELPTGTVDGINAAFNISAIATSADNLIVLINGLEQIDGVDYTFIQPTITFTIAPSIGSIVRVYYNIDTDSFTKEVPVGTINGLNAIFTLTTAPGSTNNILVLLNGLMQKENTEWSVASTTLTFVTAPAASSTLDVFYLPAVTDLQQQPASGIVNGINTVFSLSSNPQNNSLYLTLNGLYQIPTTDYTLAGSTITFIIPPAPSSDIFAFYQGPAGIFVAGSLQDAYETGNIITVTASDGILTVENSGMDPIAGNIALFDGDIEVTGIIV